MFEDAANDCCVIDQRDDVHLRATLGTRQRIDFVHFVNEPRPRRLGARGDHLCAVEGLQRCCRHGLTGPLAAATGRVPPDLPHKMLKAVRHMPAEHFEPLRAGHQLEVALQALVHVGAVHDHSGFRQVSHLLQGKRRAQHVLRELLAPLGVAGANRR